MKIKTLIVGLLLACTTSAHAQHVQEGESALVYYMPYTWAHLTLTYTETTAKVGLFVQYAERYLGTKDVVLEDGVTYCLTDATITTSTAADKDRTYKIPMGGKDKSTCYVTLNEQGVLRGLNLQTAEPSNHQTSEHSNPRTLEPSNLRTFEPSNLLTLESSNHQTFEHLMPLLEEQMMANSVAKMAEGTARQIYRIRETRLNILGGDVEHVPADGEAMRQVLAELDKQEQALTALFIGTKHTSTHTKQYTFDPARLQNGIFFRFSVFAGPVASDDLSGEPYTLTIKRSQQEYTGYVYAEEGKKKVVAPTIFYNLPGTATVSLSQAGKTILEEAFPVAQLGVSVPMNLAGMRDTEVRFDEQTGMILSVSKNKQ